MIIATANDRTDASRRAELIYAQARSQIDTRLWRAALGGGVETAGAKTRASATPMLGIAALVDLGNAASLPIDAPGPIQPVPTPTRSFSLPATVRAAAKTASAGTSAGTSAGLGVNAGYASAIADAARRTGIPAAALASIIDAEAAKNKAGVWQTGSRNARSTATGLGQFLSGTWKSQAQRPGTWLNDMAKRNGWLGSNGAVRPEMQASLLALRHDAQASINATADYARQSLDKLAAAGATIGTSVDEIARAAYLGHNLGLGDAVRFLKGGLDESRAGRLLVAQVGSSSAIRQTVAAGGAAAAHRSWLLNFIARHVNASRFEG